MVLRRLEQDAALALFWVEVRAGVRQAGEATVMELEETLRLHVPEKLNESQPNRFEKISVPPVLALEQELEPAQQQQHTMEQQVYSEPVRVLAL